MREMSDAFWIAMFAAIPGILTGITGIIIVLMKVNSLHHLVNGKFTEMLQLVASSSNTQGRLDQLSENNKQVQVVRDRRNEINSVRSEPTNQIASAAKEIVKDIKEIKEDIKDAKDHLK